MPPKDKYQCLSRDALNNLPENVIDDILMCLPLRDVVRSSILSKKWRYCWCTLPQLRLDRTHWKSERNSTDPTSNFTRIINHIYWKSERNSTDPTSNFTKIINHILTLHAGPITKFTLSIPHFRVCPDINNLICFLSRNGIQHLVVEAYYKYKLPSSIFTCLHLRHLSLEHCHICPPSGFKGFDRLLSLELCRVSISSDFPGSLISNSLLLEHLVLVHLSITNPIETNAPNLRSLVFTGYIHNICLRNVPLLAKVSVLFQPSSVKAGKYDLDKFFESIPALEHLLWKCNMFQTVIDKAVEVPRRLSSALSCLKHLYMNSLCLDELHMLRGALCLIRNSPYLQDVEIEVYQRFSSYLYPDPDKLLLNPETRDYVDEIPASFLDVTLNQSPQGS